MLSYCPLTLAAGQRLVVLMKLHFPAVSATKSQPVTAIAGCRRAMIFALAVSFHLWLAMTLCVAADEAVKVLTDRQGRTLDVIILAVNENHVRVRRNSDGREFSIPFYTFSDTSKEMLRNFKIPEPPNPALPEVDVELAISKKLLSHFRSEWEFAKKNFPKIKDPMAEFSIQHLSLLIAMEDRLIKSATPKDPASPIDWPSEVTASTRTNVEEIRQEIRDIERKTISEAEGKVLENDLLNNSRNENIALLNDLYDRATKSLRVTRDKTNKALVRINKSKSPRKDIIASLEQTSKEAGESIAALHLAFYGYKFGEKSCQDPGWPADHPAEILRKEINTLRAAIHNNLLVAENHSAETEYRIAKIGGVSIYSSNFGVILDISGSMTEHIEPLKKEIEESFQSPLYREVVGCNLSAPRLESASITPNLSPDTLSCIEELILVHKVDTIYWFCDLHDVRDKAGVEYLRDLLRMSNVRFYVRSVGLKPDRKLKALMNAF